MTHEWKSPENLHSVAWRMSGKFQRTYNSVAWRMSGKFQRTYSNVAWRMSGKFQRTYIAWHDAWVESSRELTVATEKHVLPPQVHMNVITCPPPDVYKTPRPSKGRGPTTYKVLQPIGGLWNLILGSLVLEFYLWLCDICFPLFISLSILSIKVGGLGVY